jgi:hypothetical protein
MLLAVVCGVWKRVEGIANDLWFLYVTRTSSAIELLAMLRSRVCVLEPCGYGAKTQHTQTMGQHDEANY